MAQIRLPKFGSPEELMFEEIQRFMNLTDILVERGPISVLVALRKHKLLAVSGVRVLFHELKEVALVYTPSDEPAKKTEDAEEDLLLPDDLENWWLQSTTSLKGIMKEHIALMLKIQKVQQHCLKSAHSMKKWRQRVDSAENSILLNNRQSDIEPSEQKKLVALRTAFRSKESLHVHNLHNYRLLLGKEMELRTRLKAADKYIREEVQQRFKDKIDRCLRMLNQSSAHQVSCKQEVNTEDLVKSLYSVISRPYEFTVPLEDLNHPDFDTRIKTPRVRPLPDIALTAKKHPVFGAGQIRERVASRDVLAGERPFILPLAEGTKVTQVLLSDDGTVGFGYVRKSRRSPKEWGLFETAVVKALYPWPKST